MIKEKAIKTLEKLIDDELEAIEGYNKAIKDFKDSPRIVRTLGMINEEETRHLSELQELKKCIEHHKCGKKKIEALFGHELIEDDGIELEEKEEE